MKRDYLIRSIPWILLLLISYVVFFALPAHVDRFSLIYERVIDGEDFRFFTYQFTHLDIAHMFGNLIGLALFILIIGELRADPDNVFTVFLLTGMLAALPLWFFLHSTILGASAALYGGYGISAIEGRKAGLSWYHSVAILVVISLVSFLNGGTIQTLYHLSGLVGGIVIYLFWMWIHDLWTRRRYMILQEAP